MKSKKKTTKAKKVSKKVKSPKKGKKAAQEIGLTYKTSVGDLYINGQLIKLPQEVQESVNPHAGSSFADFMEEAAVKHGFVIEQPVLHSEECMDEKEAPKAWYDSFFAIFGFKRKS